MTSSSSQCLNNEEENGARFKKRSQRRHRLEGKSLGHTGVQVCVNMEKMEIIDPPP